MVTPKTGKQTSGGNGACVEAEVTALPAAVMEHIADLANKNNAFNDQVKLFFALGMRNKLANFWDTTLAPFILVSLKKSIARHGTLTITPVGADKPEGEDEPDRIYTQTLKIG